MQRALADIFDDGVVSRATRTYRQIEALCILIGIAAMIAGTEPDLPMGWANALFALDMSLVCFFTLDWLARLWAAPLQMAAAPPARARVDWVTSRAGIICLLSVAPMALAALIDRSPSGVSLLSILWVARFAHYSRGVEMLSCVFAREKEAIAGVLYMFFAILLAGAVLEYLAERGAQPDHFGSIGQTLWWGIATLTTTGYGDAAPVTPIGRVVAGATMISGIIVFGLLAGILATGFAIEVKRRDFLRNWELVAKVPMFHDVGPGTIAELAALLRPRDLRAGSVVARKGAAGDCMFFIVAGEVEIQIAPRPIRLGEGHFFGEMALVTGGLRSATVVTTTDTQLLALDIADFRALASAKPELLHIIHEEAGRRLKSGVAEPV
jgi:voltage-gated potassium channel